MGVALKTGRRGKLRKHWYGDAIVDGKRTVFNLGVRVKGKAPPSLRGTGDVLFERSRERAEKKLTDFLESAHDKGRAEALTEKLIRSKTGQEVPHVRIADLAAAWRTGSPACEKHLLHTDATFRDFTTFVAKEQPDAVECYTVTRSTVEKYADALRTELAPTTARRKLRLLKGAFARTLPIGARNPFDPLPWTRGDRTGEEIHRRPLSPEQLVRLLETARRDAFLFPLVTTAACTGMRRGDVCRLRWEGVDLEEGILAVRTDKTGERVEIPIFTPLRAVLDTAKASQKRDVPYVWPEAAEMIEKDPHRLSRLFKRLVTDAFAEPPTTPPETPTPVVERVNLADVLPTVEAALTSLPEGPRRARITDNVKRYATGQTVRGIEKVTDRARGQISEDLHEAERLAGIHFMPEKHRVTVRAEKAIADATRQTREHGQRDASVFDWHCLRTSFVTMALTAGVPIETLQLVTGHRTVAVVLANYYRPQRAHLRTTLAGALPAVLTGDKTNLKPVEELKALTEKIATGTATPADRKRLRIVAAKV